MTLMSSFTLISASLKVSQSIFLPTCSAASPRSFFRTCKEVHSSVYMFKAICCWTDTFGRTTHAANVVVVKRSHSCIANNISGGKTQKVVVI